MTKREIENLKSSVRIEDVASRYIRLERKGKNYTGLCPFHDDHHPSLVVDSAKQTFHCFACGAHGDVITFVQQAENCSFHEATIQLTVDSGQLTDKLTGDSGQVTGGRKKKMNKDAKHLSTVNCHLSPDLSTVTCHLSTELSTVHCQLSTDKKQSFLSSLLPYSCGNTELTPAYLDFEVGQSPCQVAKEWYAMRNRLVFPIRDEEGRLVAFGARRLADDTPDEPKYINTSVADGYRKSEHLYGLFRAKKAIADRGFAFVVEGYKDAIAMHAAGLTNTVALGGTAFSDGQAQLLKKYAGTVCLLLDGDKAGRDAARRIQLSQLTEQMEVKTLYLPEGEDPDSLFRRQGREVFAALIERYRLKPHFTEELLMTACLAFADSFYVFKGEPRLFTEVLECVLRTDGLLFENDDYRAILSFLAEGNLENNLDVVMRGVADSLHADYDPLLEEDLNAFTRCYAEADDLKERYLLRLLFLYTEQRILHDIHARVRQLLDSEEGDAEIRMEMLIRIASRREQLRHVAYNLDRPGASF